MPVNPLALQGRAEALASRLPPLLLEAEHIAMTVAQGLHGLRRPGLGDNFWQFRPYMPGDAADQIDWRQSAKSDHLFIRQNEWEAPQTVWLWNDTSPSMDYKSKKKYTTKVRRSALLLLAIIALLSRGGERFALLASGLPPMSGKSGLFRATEYIIDEKRVTPSLPPFYILPRHAQMILLGDFLSPLKDIKKMVQLYAGCGVKGHIVQVLDPAEETMPFRGRVMFQGMEEDEGQIEVKRVESIKQSYQRRMRAHQRGLRQITQEAGWRFSVHRIDKAPVSALLEIYQALALRAVR